MGDNYRKGTKEKCCKTCNRVAVGHNPCRLSYRCVVCSAVTVRASSGDVCNNWEEKSDDRP